MGIQFLNDPRGPQLQVEVSAVCPPDIRFQLPVLGAGVCQNLGVLWFGKLFCFLLRGHIPGQLVAAMIRSCGVIYGMRMPV